MLIGKKEWEIEIYLPFGIILLSLEIRMPKVTDRRIDKANELLRMLERGPATSFDIFDKFPTDLEINKNYKLWAKSWIIPLVKELVPELKKKRSQDVKAS